VKISPPRSEREKINNDKRKEENRTTLTIPPTKEIKVLQVHHVMMCVVGENVYYIL